MTDRETSGERWPEWLPLRSVLRGRTPYGAPQIEASARLNTNENPYPLPASVITSIATGVEEILSGLNRYPDRDAIELRSRLATYVNDRLLTSAHHQSKITPAHIWPANGSNEVLQSILLAFGESVAGFTPSYSMHPILTEAVGKSFKTVPLKSDFLPDIELLRGFLAAKKPEIFFLTTPNNPTGRSLPIATIAEIASMIALHRGLLIVDEAYGEFSAEESAVNLIDQHPHVVVVRTMSKAFAFAGARIGYAIARPEVIDALQLVRLPYHLSAITQAAAIAAIDHSDVLLAEVEEIRVNRDATDAALREMGFLTVPSDANFILFGGFADLNPSRAWDSAALWRALLDRDVLIRDVGIPGFLRVTIGTSEENAAFLESLRQVIGS